MFLIFFCLHIPPIYFFCICKFCVFCYYYYLWLKICVLNFITFKYGLVFQSDLVFYFSICEYLYIAKLCFEVAAMQSPIRKDCDNWKKRVLYIIIKILYNLSDLSAARLFNILLFSNFLLYDTTLIIKTLLISLSVWYWG